MFLFFFLVLNLSKNELFRISDLEVMANLNALILNNNRIRKMDGLATLKELNTLGILIIIICLLLLFIIYVLF